MLSLGTNGHRIQIQWGSVVAFTSLLVMLMIASWGGMRAWGEGQGRLNAVEDRQTVTERVVEEIRKKIESVAESQAATQSTVESIKEQQTIDRQSIDNRLDDILDAVRRGPQ